MLVGSRSGSYFAPASSRLLPGFGSAVKVQRTHLASISCQGVPLLLGWSAPRVRIANDALLASPTFVKRKSHPIVTGPWVGSNSAMVTRYGRCPVRTESPITNPCFVGESLPRDVQRS